MTVFGDFETIKVGDKASVIKKITEDDIRRFVEMTGDSNPLHVDKTRKKSKNQHSPAYFRKPRREISSL